MALKTLTLLLTATGIAVAFYRLGQQSPTAPAALDESPDATGTNPAERLQDLKLANAGMGALPDDGHDDLLAPPRAEEQQSDSIRPGLPDLARGA